MGTASDAGQGADGVVLTDAPVSRADGLEWLPAGLIAAVAALLSLPRLGQRTLWLDEAYTVGATNELLDTWRHTGVTQALYYASIWPLTRLSIDPAWIRLPSALFGLAAVVVVYRVGRRLGGPLVAALGAGGLALSWGLARYSVEARSYTLALLLASISWLALIAAVQTGDDDPTGDGDRRWWRLFYVATALLPLAHGLGTLNFVVQVGALAVAPHDRRALVRRAVLVAPLLAVELAAMFALGAAAVGDWVAPLHWGQVRTFKQLLLGFGATGLVLGVLTAVATVDVVRRYARQRSREAWMQVLPVFWAIGPTVVILLMSLARPYAAPRYVFFSLPAYFLLIAGLFVRHLASTGRVVLAGLVLVPFLLADQHHVVTEGVEDWSELVACIAANAEPGDRLVTGEVHRTPLDYYWNDHPELSQVEALSPPEPLGQVRRLYEGGTSTDAELDAVLLEDTSESIWYVDRLALGRMVVLGLAFDREVGAHYRLVEPWYFEGNLTLTRLDPLGRERPRGETSCDTVPTPDDMRPPDARD